MTMRRLTDTIIAEWYDRVKDDYASDLPSQEDIQEYLNGKDVGGNIYHVYGTTLIAALWLPKCLLLIQQGDGRCDVFYEDGSVDQPIPWDARCEENVTTSMCDSDVANSIRWTVVDLHDNAVIACVLESDGVEDAYRDTYIDLGKSHELMGGVHTFNKNLLVHACSMTPDAFLSYLDEALPLFSEVGLFSKAGSGDDVSVAVVANKEKIRKIASRYEKEIKRYDLDEKLIGKEEELRSKMRKHDILLRRMKDAESVLNEENKQLARKNETIASLENEISKFHTLIETLQQIIELCGHGSNTIEHDIFDYFALHDKDILSKFGLKVEDVVAKPLRIRTRLIKEQNELIASLESIEVELERCLADRDAYTQRVESSKELFEKAKAAFDEYDEGYQKIEREINLILEQIDSINKGQLSDEADNHSLPCVDSENLGEQAENEEKQAHTEAEGGQDAEENACEYPGPMLMGDIIIDDLTGIFPEGVRPDKNED